MKTNPTLILILMLAVAGSYAQHNTYLIKQERQYVLLMDSSFYYKHVDNDEDFCYTKELYTYNEYGNIETMHLKYIATNEDYSYENRTTFYYNNQQVLTEKIQDSRMEDRWVPYKKDVYAYDNRRLLTERLVYYNDSVESPIWYFGEKNECNYNFNNDITSRLRYYWSTETNDWAEASYEQYFYNSLNLLDVYRYNLWSEELEEFVFRSKTKHEYDSNDRLEKTSFFYWEEDMNEWIERNNSFYAYNDDLLYERVDDYWNSDSAKWKHLWKHTYVYDTSQNLLCDSSHFWSDYYQNYGYNKRIRNFYSLHVVNTTSIEEVVKDEIVLFPNPTKGDIWLSGRNLSGITNINVYNNKGQLIRQQDYKNNIKLKGVSRGIYYIDFWGKNKKITKKIIVE